MSVGQEARGCEDGGTAVPEDWEVDAPRCGARMQMHECHGDHPRTWSHLETWPSRLGTLDSGPKMETVLRTFSSRVPE